MLWGADDRAVQRRRTHPDRVGDLGASRHHAQHRASPPPGEGGVLAGLARPAGATGRASPRARCRGSTTRCSTSTTPPSRRPARSTCPGPETEALGEICREYGVFLMAQAKARHPEWPERYFNVGFILDDRGELILTHYKTSPLFPVEHSVCPHDVYDWWIERYGRDARGVLAGGRHADRPARHHDGQRGLVSGERPRPGHERRRGRVPRVDPAPGGVERLLRDPEPGSRPGQQPLHRRPQHGHLLPPEGLGGAHRHLRRRFDDRRLQGPDRRRPALRRRVDVGVAGRSTSRRSATTAPPARGRTG